jgi:proteasome lid subunit RPN8/RPN11
MTVGAGVNAALGSWSFEGSSRTIECAAPLIDQIGAAAREGFMRFPHGGVEIGGVLFGVRHRDTVRIMASRALTIEYAKGPSFVLSEADEAALRALIESAHKDPELRGLDVAGWYESHTRRDLKLSERDLALFDRHFSEPWHICMVFKPEAQSPTRITTYVRAEGGSLCEAAAYREIKFYDLEVQEAATPPESKAPAPLAAVEQEPVTPARSVAEAIPREQPRTVFTYAAAEPRPRSSRRYWIAALIAAVCACAGLWLWGPWLRPNPAANRIESAPAPAQPAATPTPREAAPTATPEAAPPAKPVRSSKHSRGKRIRHRRARSRRAEP